MQSTKTHDRVNRVQEIVVLPTAGIRTKRNLHPGDIIELVNVAEADINCYYRDPMLMDEPVRGDAVGDAVFDAMGAGPVVFDANAEITLRLVTSDLNPYLTSGGKVLEAKTALPVSPSSIVKTTQTTKVSLSKTVSVTKTTTTGDVSVSESVSETTTVESIRVKDLPKDLSDGYLPLDSEGLGTGKYDISRLYGSIAQVFDPDKAVGTSGYAYIAGECVMYGGGLYRFTSGHTGAWTGTDVELVSATDVTPLTEITPEEVEDAWDSTEPEA